MDTASSDRVTINARSWHWCKASRLAIVPELAGARHEFPFEGRQTVVKLPSRVPEIGGKYDPHAPLTCDSWRQVDGVNIPLRYGVHEFAMYIDITDSIIVPAQALKLPNTQYELFSEREQKQLGVITKEQEKIADRALSYWLKVLRWKSRIGFIGEPEIRMFDDSGVPRLQDITSGHTFWCGPFIAFAEARQAITQEVWQDTSKALASGAVAPIWFDFLFDSQHRLNNSDFTAAILSMAIALEVMVRKLVTHHLDGLPIESILHEVIDTANFRSILNRIGKLSFWSEELKRACDLSAFNELMSVRDKVMHSADTSRVDPERLQAIYNRLETFAYAVSGHLLKEPSDRTLG